MDLRLLDGTFKTFNVNKAINYKYMIKKSHPTYFNPEGLLVFCGSQGSGKTLSAVQYIKKVCELYPRCILVTNTEIKGLPSYTKVIEYEDIEILTHIENC